jgi:hypothetical protein
MANAFLKPEVIVSQGLGLLQRELILPRLVQRYGKADFRGAKNDTINIKIPSILTAREYEWRTRTAPIEFDDLEETTIDVKLDKHPYSAVAITDEELTLDIESWGFQVARPQIRAVAEKLEGYIATRMQTSGAGGTDYKNTVTYTADADPESHAFYDALVDARQKLNEENIPQGGRVVVLGANVEAAALKGSSHLLKANEAASDSVLREAILGRIAGFTVIGGVNSVDPDFAVAFHPTAFAFANVAPDVPEGAAAGAGLVFEGLAMRWIRDYDAPYLRDRSVYSAFAGTASVEDERDDEGALTGKNVRAVEIEFVGLGS